MKERAAAPADARSMSDSRTIAFVAGSPSTSSKAASLQARVAARAGRDGIAVHAVEVRTLPPGELLTAARDSATLRAAHETIAAATGVVVATPVYKAAYTGLLKAFLDTLPEGALRGKAVLPVVTAAAPVHALVLDYALKPVLASLFPGVVATGFFGLDKEFVGDGDAVRLGDDAAARFDAAVDAFLTLARTM